MIVLFQFANLLKYFTNYILLDSIELIGFEETKCPLKLMSRYELKCKIARVYTIHQTQLQKLFSGVPFLCLTVDIWGNKHRSFFGCTAHYIDSESLERKSYALCCTRFPHPHTNDQIAEQVQLTYANYGLTSQKVFAALMDNASNFDKAFREFGNDHVEFVKYVDNELEINNNNDRLEDVYFAEIPETIILPNSMKCGSHTLNLIGTKDISEAQKNNVYAKMYVSAFGKLNRLWNKTNYSKSSETIEKFLHSSLRRPCIIRWNAIPSSVSEVLSKDPVQLDALMTEFEIPLFSPQERNFLSEYIQVLTPITSALNNLQKTNCYYGILLPTLFTVKRALLGLENDVTIKYCKPLANAALTGLMRRFKNIMDFESKYSVPALIASCTLPYFKFRWLCDEKTLQNMDHIKGLLVKAANDLEPTSCANNNGECVQTECGMVVVMKYYKNDLCLIMFLLRSQKKCF